MDQTQQQSTYSSAKRRPIVLLLAMCAVAALAAWLMFAGSQVLGMLLLAVMGGIFAVLFLTASHPVLMAVGASVSVMLLQILGGFSASLCGLVMLIAALALSYQVRRRAPKTTALVTLSLILGGGFLLLAAVFYALDGGSLAPNDLLDSYNAFFGDLKVEFSTVVHEWVEGIDEKTLALYAQMEITKEMLLDSYLDGMETAVDMLQLMLPGLLILMIQLLAYAEIAAFRAVACLTHVEALLPAPQWKLVPTQVSCIVYIAVAIIYVIGSFIAAADSAFIIIMTNLWLSLLPTMLLCGVRVLFVRLKHPMYRMGTSMIVAIFVFGLFLVPSVAIAVALFALAFLGAQTISAMHAVEAEKNKKQ